MKRTTTMGTAFIALLLLAGESSASGWFLTADVAMGRADQEIERGFHITGRYVLDLGPAYKFTGENGTVEVQDSAFFIGAGFELPI